MCSHSKKNAQAHAKEGNYFGINRNITDLKELAKHLTVVRKDKKDAEKRVAMIDKTIKEYEKREGLTNFPITIENLCQNIPGKLLNRQFLLNAINYCAYFGQAFKFGSRDIEGIFTFLFCSINQFLYIFW